jgi:hypothetical protein
MERLVQNGNSNLFKNPPFAIHTFCESKSNLPYLEVLTLPKEKNKFFYNFLIYLYYYIII